MSSDDRTSCVPPPLPPLARAWLAVAVGAAMALALALALAWAFQGARRQGAWRRVWGSKQGLQLLGSIDDDDECAHDAGADCDAGTAHGGSRGGSRAIEILPTHTMVRTPPPAPPPPTTTTTTTTLLLPASRSPLH